MKALIISDVHSNITALESVWEKEKDADVIICAGDLVDYGLHPREVIDWMIHYQAYVVRGNHDAGVIDAYENPDEDSPLMWRHENAKKLDQHHYEYLKQLPPQLSLDIDNHTYGVTHAYKDYEILRSVQSFRELSQARFADNLDRLIFGHTHRRELHYLSDEVFWLNPGSTSYRRPDENYRGAHYAIFQDGQISLREVPYAIDELYKLLLQSKVCPQDRSPPLHWWGPQ